jgi:hypothetical protein
MYHLWRLSTFGSLAIAVFFFATENKQRHRQYKRLYKSIRHSLSTYDQITTQLNPIHTLLAHINPIAPSR